MILSKVGIVTGLLLYYAVTSPILTISENALAAYDVIVVGGGPAGLTAASALGRVRRSALLIDSGVYRNAPTQEVHDVITRDGTVLSEFRALAREQISVYTSVSMMNGTVSSIVPERHGDLAMEYADARVEAESAHIKRGAQKPFEALKRELPSPMAEFNSARELLEYMNG